MRTWRTLRQKVHAGGRFLRYLFRTTRTTGLLSTLRVAGRTARAHLIGDRRDAASRSTFDRTYGFDTDGVIKISALDIDSSNVIFGIQYRAIAPERFLPVLRNLGIQYQEYTFIDLGSGKGRVILLASEFPFRKIIGVEFARDLHEIAIANIARRLSQQPACSDLRSICSDAALYQFPDSEPLLVFAYEPFEAPVFEAVLQNLSGSYRRCPRPVIFVYHSAGSGSVLSELGPAHRRLIEATGIFRRVPYGADECTSVYATHELGPGAAASGSIGESIALGLL